MEELQSTNSKGNNPISRRNSMTKMFSTIILSGLAMMSTAYAQSSQPIQAKVPFAFTVQGTILAAGNYRLTYSDTHGSSTSEVSKARGVAHLCSQGQRVRLELPKSPQSWSFSAMTRRAVWRRYGRAASAEIDGWKCLNPHASANWASKRAWFL
jgi:hypothetical protein